MATKPKAEVKNRTTMQTRKGGRVILGDDRDKAAVASTNESLKEDKGNVNKS